MIQNVIDMLAMKNSGSSTGRREKNSEIGKEQTPTHAEQLFLQRSLLVNYQCPLQWEHNQHIAKTEPARSSELELAVPQCQADGHSHGGG